MQKEEIKATVHETLSALGVDIDDPREVQADMIYLRKIRNASEEINARVKLGLIWSLILLGFVLVTHGLKTSIPEWLKMDL